MGQSVREGDIGSQMSPAASLAPVSWLVRAHIGGGILIQLSNLAHEQQVLLFLLQLGHCLLASLQFLLRPCQLLTQPLVLLYQPSHLSPKLLLL